MMTIYTGICRYDVITRMALHPFDGPPLGGHGNKRRRWPFRVVFRWHSSKNSEPWFMSCRGEKDSQSAARQFATDDEAIAWLVDGEP